jgi:uncharacterized membrane protein
MDENSSKGKKTFTEEIEVMGNQLVEQVKDLLKEGNVRQLRIKASDGDIILETPLTFGVVAGGAMVLAAPWLAIIGAIAAFVTHARVEVVREVDEDSPIETESPANKPSAKPASSRKPKATAKPKTASKAKAKPSAKAKTPATPKS